MRQERSIEGGRISIGMPGGNIAGELVRLTVYCRSCPVVTIEADPAQFAACLVGSRFADSAIEVNEARIVAAISGPQSAKGAV